MEIILRYNNRKLYSKTLKKYVNNTYLVDNIRTNMPFKILKHEKGVSESGMKDITAHQLAQILTTLNLTREVISNIIVNNI